MRRSVGTLSTAIVFTAKTSTSFRLIRWAFRRQQDNFWLNVIWSLLTHDPEEHLFPSKICCFPSSSGKNTLSWGVCGVLLHVEEVWTSRVLYPAGHQGRPKEVQPAVGERVSIAETLITRFVALGEMKTVRPITPELKHDSANRLWEWVRPALTHLKENLLFTFATEYTEILMENGKSEDLLSCQSPKTYQKVIIFSTSVSEDALWCLWRFPVRPNLRTSVTNRHIY